MAQGEALEQTLNDNKRWGNSCLIFSPSLFFCEQNHNGCGTVKEMSLEWKRIWQLRMKWGEKSKSHSIWTWCVCVCAAVWSGLRWDCARLCVCVCVFPNAWAPARSYYRQHTNNSQLIPAVSNHRWNAIYSSNHWRSLNSWLQNWLAWYTRNIPLIGWKWNFTQNVCSLD